MKKKKKEEKSKQIYMNFFSSQYSFFFYVVSYLTSHRTTHNLSHSAWTTQLAFLFVTLFLSFSLEKTGRKRKQLPNYCMTDARLFGFQTCKLPDT